MGADVSDEELLEEMRRLASDGTPPSCSEMDKDGRYSSGQIISRFDGWNNAKRAAGLEVERKAGESKYSDEELLGEIQRLASDGKPPSFEKINEDGRYPGSSIQNHFGGWNTAIREAGFSLNKKGEWNKEELLRMIRRHSDGKIAITPDEFDKKSCSSISTLKDHFGTWWRAVVQAGLQPQTKRPLTPLQYHQFREASLSRVDPQESMIGLLMVYTGLDAHCISQMEPSWWEHLDQSPYQPVVTVPGSVTTSGDQWVFKIPARFHINNQEYTTELPDLAKWYYTSLDDPSFLSDNEIFNTVAQIASDMGTTTRRKTSYNNAWTQIDERAEVREVDLNATVGTHLARRGAPSQLIHRHLGIDHTTFSLTVEDLLLWCYVHYDHDHPEFNPPDIVLDPVGT